MNCSIWVNDSITDDYTIRVSSDSPESYRCHLAIIKEEDGDFSAVVLNLPGAGSCGDTEDEDGWRVIRITGSHLSWYPGFERYP